MIKILVIDDDQFVREMLLEQLSEWQYESRGAENGRIGVRECRLWHPDIVITDILMPDQEGFETIIQLKKEFPGIKIIAISGALPRGSANYLQIALRLGASFTFKKPVSLAELLSAIKTFSITTI